MELAESRASWFRLARISLRNIRVTQNRPKSGKIRKYLEPKFLPNPIHAEDQVVPQYSPPKASNERSAFRPP
jgi:hypothetical protein